MTPETVAFQVCMAAPDLLDVMADRLDHSAQGLRDIVADTGAPEPKLLAAAQELDRTAARLRVIGQS